MTVTLEQMRALMPKLDEDQLVFVTWLANADVILDEEAAHTRLEQIEWVAAEVYPHMQMHPNNTSLYLSDMPYTHALQMAPATGEIWLQRLDARPREPYTILFYELLGKALRRDLPQFDVKTVTTTGACKGVDEYAQQRAREQFGAEFPNMTDAEYAQIGREAEAECVSEEYRAYRSAIIYTLKWAVEFLKIDLDFDEQTEFITLTPQISWLYVVDRLSPGGIWQALRFHGNPKDAVTDHVNSLVYIFQYGPREMEDTLRNVYNGIRQGTGQG